MCSLWNLEKTNDGVKRQVRRPIERFLSTPMRRNEDSNGVAGRTTHIKRAREEDQVVGGRVQAANKAVVLAQSAWCSSRVARRLQGSEAGLPQEVVFGQYRQQNRKSR